MKFHKAVVTNLDSRFSDEVSSMCEVSESLFSSINGYFAESFCFSGKFYYFRNGHFLISIADFLSWSHHSTVRVSQFMLNILFGVRAYCSSSTNKRNNSINALFKIRLCRLFCVGPIHAVALCAQKSINKRIYVSLFIYYLELLFYCWHTPMTRVLVNWG